MMMFDQAASEAAPFAQADETVAWQSLATAEVVDRGAEVVGGAVVSGALELVIGRELDAARALERDAAAALSEAAMEEARAHPPEALATALDWTALHDAPAFVTVLPA